MTKMRRHLNLLGVLVVSMAGALGAVYFSKPDSNSARLGFETGGLQGWSLKRLANPQAAQVITSTAFEGQFAVAVTLPVNEGYGDSWKSELSDDFSAPFHEEIWYRIAHYIPEDFDPPTEGACAVAQWHHVSPPSVIGGRKPPLAHRLRRGGFDAAIDYEGVADDARFRSVQKVLFRMEPLKKGMWHDFIYRVVWSPDDTGEVDLWYQGQWKASYRGPLGYAGDPKGPYFKSGVHCGAPPKTPLTAYFDNYRRGSRVQAVLDPGEKLSSERASAFQMIDERRGTWR